MMAVERASQMKVVRQNVFAFGFSFQELKWICFVIQRLYYGSSSRCHAFCMAAYGVMPFVWQRMESTSHNNLEYSVAQTHYYHTTSTLLQNISAFHSVI
jgi:hypothetical protein